MKLPTSYVVKVMPFGHMQHCSLDLNSSWDWSKFVDKNSLADLKGKEQSIDFNMRMGGRILPDNRLKHQPLAEPESV